MASPPSPKIRKLGVLERPLDMIVIVLLCYFMFSCWCIEVKYCADGLDARDTRFMMPETFAFAKDHNPYFLSGPRWLRVATCGSAYCFSCGYLMIAVGYLFGVNAIRVPTLLFIGAKVYALVFYHVMEFTSDMRPPNLVPYLAPELPYLVSIVLVLFRMRKPSPFSVVNSEKCA